MDPRSLFSSTKIKEAFERDGYKMKALATCPNIDREKKVTSIDNVGIYGINETNHRLYYLLGNSYQFGWLTGYLAEDMVAKMVTTYIEHLGPTFLSFRLDLEMKDHEVLNRVYTWVLKKVAKFIEKSTYESYLRNKSSIPQDFDDEMKGIVDGCKAKNPTTVVTYENVVTLNYVNDNITVWVYSGELMKWIKKEAAEIKESHPQIAEFISKRLDTSYFKVPDACDGFYVKDSMTVTGQDRYLCRDYQLQNAQVWQDTNAMFVYNPVNGSLPMVAVTAPGQVGCFTALNSKGFGCGFDMVRSADVNHLYPGLGGTMMMRYLGHTAISVKHAQKLLGKAKRGSAWIYLLGDSGGCGCVGEGGKRQKKLNPLEYIDPSLKYLLPSNEFIKKHSHKHHKKGIYFRCLDYDYPSEYLEFNKGLFESVGLLKVYQKADFNNCGGHVFKYFQSELKVQKSLQNKYFPPARCSRDYVIASNQYIIPEMRITQMAKATNDAAGTADSIQWRFDELASELEKNRGKVDFEKAKDLITNLSPWKQPDYSLSSEQYGIDGVTRDTPGKVQIEGALSVLDLRTIYIETKSSYWGDDWSKCTLMNYI